MNCVSKRGPLSCPLCLSGCLLLQGQPDSAERAPEGVLPTGLGISNFQKRLLLWPSHCEVDNRYPSQAHTERKGTSGRQFCSCGSAT